MSSQTTRRNDTLAGYASVHTLLYHEASSSIVVAIEASPLGTPLEVFDQITVCGLLSIDALNI